MLETFDLKFISDQNLQLDLESNKNKIGSVSFYSGTFYLNRFNISEMKMKIYGKKYKSKKKERIASKKRNRLIDKSSLFKEGNAMTSIRYYTV